MTRYRLTLPVVVLACLVLVGSAAADIIYVADKSNTDYAVAQGSCGVVTRSLHAGLTLAA